MKEAAALVLLSEDFLPGASTEMELRLYLLGGRGDGGGPPTCLGPAPLGSTDTPSPAQNQVPILTLEP